MFTDARAFCLLLLGGSFPQAQRTDRLRSTLSILRRLFYVIDHEDVYRPFRRFEAEPELLLKR